MGATTTVVYQDQPTTMSDQHYLSLVAAVQEQLHRRFAVGCPVPSDPWPSDPRTPMGRGSDETDHQVDEMFLLWEQERAASDLGFWL